MSKWKTYIDMLENKDAVRKYLEMTATIVGMRREYVLILMELYGYAKYGREEGYLEGLLSDAYEYALLPSCAIGEKFLDRYGKRIGCMNCALECLASKGYVSDNGGPPHNYRLNASIFAGLEQTICLSAILRADGEMKITRPYKDGDNIVRLENIVLNAKGRDGEACFEWRSNQQ